MKINNFFLLFPFFSILTCTNSGNTVTGHNRRTLHQPFFPPDSPAVTPPSRSNIPFTPNPTTAASPPADRPFFQNLSSPPPPPPSPSASFPATIPSINLPNSPKSKPVSSKLIATAVTLVIVAGIGIAIVVYLRIQKRRTYDHDSRSFQDQKSNRSDSGSRVVVSYNINNGTGFDNMFSMTPQLNRPSQSSAEFLYLGTLVNPHGEPHNHREGDGDSNFRKLDSPELRPLPPLNNVGSGGRSGGNFRDNSFENVEFESSKDEESEVFYSPGGSMGTGSDAMTEFVVRVDDYVSGKINGLDSSTCSSSSSGSLYPARSMSLSISPSGSLSPVRSSPNSPDLNAIQIQTAPPPPPPSHSLIVRSPDVRLTKDNVDSAPGLSGSSSDQNSPPSARIPPPPPPPPPKNWQTSPKTPTPPIRPPVLIKPALPVPLANDKPPVSATELSPEIQETVETPKPKLKPLHWVKVRASSDRETVWDQLKSSSFKLNEKMIESLFVVKTPNSNAPSATNHPMPPWPPASQENRVLDPKKSQNIAILLRALNVTIEEVCDALLEGNAETLGTELLESLLKMAPTKEEERKLKDYKDDSPVKLGPAEKFLKAVLDVPFAFKRVDAMLYISNFECEVEYLTRSFQTLEFACEELRNSRMFLKLLEAVLKTGNRMNVGTNRGDAQAFKLDTLLKLIDVKGTDGKTSLLHFVIQEIIKSEGARLSTPDSTTPTSDTKSRKLGLQLVTKISSELTNVKKAAAIDAEVLNSDVTKLSKGISDILQVVRLNDTIPDRKIFSESMNMFMETAEEVIIRIQTQESVVFSLVKEVTEYFHGNSAKEEAHPFRIFTVVRDFLNILDRVCKEVGSINDRIGIGGPINDRIVIGSGQKFPIPVNPTLPAVFSGLPENRQYSCSDDEGSSSFQSS